MTNRIKYIIICLLSSAMLASCGMSNNVKKSLISTETLSTVALAATMHAVGIPMNNTTTKALFDKKIAKAQADSLKRQALNDSLNRVRQDSIKQVKTVSFIDSLANLPVKE